MINRMVESTEKVGGRKWIVLPPGRKRNPVSIKSERRETEVQGKIVNKPVDALRPSPIIEKAFPPMNPGEYKKLRDDIDKRGIQDPLQVTKNGDIFCGHHRWRAAKELGFETVPCVEKILPPREILSHAIKDNLCRRNFNRKQRTELATNLLAQFGRQPGRPKEKDQMVPFMKLDEIAELSGVSKTTVKRINATLRQKHSPVISAKPKKDISERRKEFKDRETMVGDIKDYVSVLVKKYANKLASIVLTVMITGDNFPRPR